MVSTKTILIKKILLISFLSFFLSPFLPLSHPPSPPPPSLYRILNNNITNNACIFKCKKAKHWHCSHITWILQNWQKKKHCKKYRCTEQVNTVEKGRINGEKDEKIFEPEKKKTTNVVWPKLKISYKQSKGGKKQTSKQTNKNLASCSINTNSNLYSPLFFHHFPIITTVVMYNQINESSAI